jgi:hypothetical protein
MIDRATWNERPVTFAEFSLVTGDQVIDAYAVSSRYGGRVLLLHTLRYADTGEPVFASVAEIEAVPFRQLERITYLTARGAFVNGFGDDPDAPPKPGAVQPNGHAATAPSS